MNIFMCTACAKSKSGAKSFGLPNTSRASSRNDTATCMELSTAQAWGPFENGEASHIIYPTPTPTPTLRNDTATWVRVSGCGIRV